MSLHTLSFLFLIMTCFGVAASLCVVKLEAVGRRYFVLTGIQVATVGILALVFLGVNLPNSARIAFGVFLALTLLASLCRGTQWNRAFWPLEVGALVAAGAGFYFECLTHFDIESALVAGLGSFVFARISSGLYVGFTLAAMLLGHWYLTQPKMPIDELKRMTLCFLVLSWVRILTVSFFVYRWIGMAEEPDLLKLFVSTTPGLFLMMRWAWGLLLPAVLGAMVWQTVKIRSTQSATGILYVCTLAVFTGEIMALYLTLTQRTPF